MQGVFYTNVPAGTLLCGTLDIAHIAVRLRGRFVQRNNFGSYPVA